MPDTQRHTGWLAQLDLLSLPPAALKSHLLALKLSPVAGSRLCPYAWNVAVSKCLASFPQQRANLGRTHWQSDYPSSSTSVSIVRLRHLHNSRSRRSSRLRRPGTCRIMIALICATGGSVRMYGNIPYDSSSDSKTVSGSKKN